MPMDLPKLLACSGEDGFPVWRFQFLALVSYQLFEMFETCSLPETNTAYFHCGTHGMAMDNIY